MSMAFWRPGDAIPATSLLATSLLEPNEIDHPPPSIPYNPNQNRPIQIQREKLPIYAHKNELLFAMEDHSITIVAGDIGSGKSTQIPQYLLQANWAAHKKIVCTQPRRIAAIATAQRIASQLNESVGNRINYAVQFDERCDSQNTRVKVCTDEMLLRECIFDPLLSQYSVVIIDEVQERSMYSDLLLSLMKKILRHRAELRLVIAMTEQYIDTIADFFRNNVDVQLKLAIVAIQRRQFPMELMYLSSPCKDYIEEAYQTAIKIHSSKPPGDILIFLPTQQDIEQLIRLFDDYKSEKRNAAQLLVLPFYHSLSSSKQQQVYQPAPRYISRKIIVASSIAENCITMQGIQYVIDSCYTKLSFYNPFTGTEAFITTAISRSSATLHARRANREEAGECYRLCTESYFHENTLKETMPMMERSRLERIVLYLFSLGIRNLASFDFVSPPSPEAMIRALDSLYSLRAITDDNQLTDIVGLQLVELALDPFIAKMLLASVSYHCVDQVLDIASLLSVNDIFILPRGSKEKRAKIMDAISQFAHPLGDIFTSLTVYSEFLRASKSRKWCEENFIHYRALARAHETRKQLKDYMQRRNLLGSQTETPEMTDAQREEAILKSFLSGFFANFAQLDVNHGGKYRVIHANRLVDLDPSCIYTNAGHLPQYIIYYQSIHRKQEYIRNVSKIDPRWLLEIAPHFYNVKNISALISGSSGDLGLPKTNVSSYSAQTKAKFSSLQNCSARETKAPNAEISNEKSSRILFKKPQKPESSKKKPLPVHIGKSKGGLRSQF